MEVNTCPCPSCDDSINTDICISNLKELKEELSNKNYFNIIYNKIINDQKVFEKEFEDFNHVELITINLNSYFKFTIFKTDKELLDKYFNTKENSLKSFNKIIDIIIKNLDLQDPYKSEAYDFDKNVTILFSDSSIDLLIYSIRKEEDIDSEELKIKLINKNKKKEPITDDEKK